MLRGLRYGVAEAKRELSNLPKINQLDCADGQSDRLTLTQFKNPYISWIGIARDRHIVCRGSHIDFEVAHGLQLRSLEPGWAL